MPVADLFDSAARSRVERVSERLAQLEAGLLDLSQRIPSMAREAGALREELDKLQPNQEEKLDA